jgi:hypothetical protein
MVLSLTAVAGASSASANCSDGKTIRRPGYKLKGLFRSPEVPFGSSCEKIELTCSTINGGQWITPDGNTAYLSDFSNSCSPAKPQPCFYDSVMIAHGKTRAFFPGVTGVRRKALPERPEKVREQGSRWGGIVPVLRL